MGKQFVRHTTRVVSAAHCHNLREQTRVLQSLQDICLQQVGVLRRSRQQAWDDLHLELYQYFGGSQM
jgi:hypothetical protein